MEVKRSNSHRKENTRDCLFPVTDLIVRPVGPVHTPAPEELIFTGTPPRGVGT